MDHVRAVTRRDPFAVEIKKQLLAYFSKDITEFNLPFLMEQGTDYQMRVWDQIRKISFGKTKTYGEIATKIKSGPRAVGKCLSTQSAFIVSALSSCGQCSWFRWFYGRRRRNTSKKKTMVARA